VIADRLGDGFRQTLGAGVIAAHKALQFGEFADHSGDEIGLAQARCLFGHIRKNFLRHASFRWGDDVRFNQPPRQLGHAINLVGDGAQLFVEGDPPQPLGVFGQGLLLILLPEEARIRQSRGQHLAVAVHHHGGINRGDIRGADESIGQAAIWLRANEILLVHPRGELDNLGRHIEKCLVETPQQRHRPFSETGVFNHQPFIGHQRQACVGGHPRCAFADDSGAFFVVDDHMAGAQLFGVIVR